MSQPYRYKRRAEDILHLFQEDYQLHAKDKTRHDVHSNMYHAVIEETEGLRYKAERYEQDYLDLKSRRLEVKWNELRIALGRLDREIDPQKVLDLMLWLDLHNGDIRNKINDLRTKGYWDWVETKEGVL